MADSEIELDAETGDDELKKKKQKVLQKYLPGYHDILIKFGKVHSLPTFA